MAMADKDFQEHLVQTLESIADYAAMIEGALKKLRSSGLSEEGAEDVLLYILGITPVYFDEDELPCVCGECDEEDED
jgi:hypothetical protein